MYRNIFAIILLLAGLAVSWWLYTAAIAEEVAYREKLAAHEVFLVTEAVDTYRNMLRDTAATSDGIPSSYTPALADSVEEAVVTGFRRRRQVLEDLGEDFQSPEIYDDYGFLGKRILPRREGILARAGKGLWLLVSAGFGALLLAALTKKFIFN